MSVIDKFSVDNVEYDFQDSKTPLMVASTYSSSSTYAVGDYVTYDGTLYKCTTAIDTAEEWTSGHWTAVALGDDVSELKSALDNNTNVTAEQNIAPIKTGTTTISSLSVSYSPYEISFNGTSGANGSFFLTDFFTLPAGNYSFTDGYEQDAQNCDLRVLNSSNAQLANSYSSQTFTLAEATSVRVLIYIFGGKTFNNAVLRPNLHCTDDVVYSNATITTELQTNTNITAGENVVPLSTGTWSGNSVTFTYNKNGSLIINGTPSANSSAFFSDSITLPTGTYIVEDGTSGHDGSYYVAAFSTSAIGRSDNIGVGNIFTLESATSIKLLIWVASGTTFTNLTLTPKVVDMTALSNEDLSKPVKLIVNHPADVVKTAVDIGYFPWAVDAPSNANNKLFYDAVENIRIYGGDFDGDYYFYQVMINNTTITPNGTYITIYNGDGTKVCQYYGLLVPTGKQTLFFNEMNNSGITAVVDVDFTDITGSYSSYGFGSYFTFGISPQAIIPTNTVEILVPSNIYAVVGMEYNIYWNAAIKCPDINDVIVEVVGNGMNLGNRWSYKPTTAETFSITIRVRDKQYRLLGSKTITVTAVAKAVGTATTLKVIHIGDSMIANAYHLAALQADMADSGITYNIIGTMPYSEGRGGWTSGMYITYASDSLSVTNAFYNPSTQTFDFNYYMTQQGYSDVDVVWIWLGTNDAKGMTGFDSIESMRLTIGSIEKMIDSIHDYDSTIKVCINTCAIGAEEQYPFAKLYSNNDIKQPLHKYGIQMQTKFMLTAFEGREDENIYLVPTGTSLDNVHGFPTTTTTIADKINTSITVQSDPFHPSEVGWDQLTDCEYAFIRNKLV